MTRILAILVLLSGCVGDDTLRRVLEDEGYTDVEPGGYAFFDCSDDDVFQSNFRAKRNGRVVNGAVCCGWFKNCTVRH